MTKPLSSTRQKSRSLRRMLRRQVASRRLVVELQVLHEVGRAINQALQLDEVLHTIHVQTGRLMDTRHFYIALYDAQQHMIEFSLAVEGGEIVAWTPRPWNDGITEWVITNNRPLRINYSHDPTLTTPIVIGITPRSILAVPISIGDNVFGMMSVQSPERDDAYTERDQFILTMIADQAAVAIANARRFEAVNNELAQRLAQLETLEAIVRDLNATLDAELILEHLVARVCTTMKADAGMVALISENRQFLVVKSLYGYSVTNRQFMSSGWSIDRGIAGKVVRTRLPEWTADVRVSTDYVSSRDSTLSQMTVPIKHKNQVLGVLILESDKLAAFNQEMLRFVCQVADHAALSIYNAQIYQQTLAQQTLLEQRSQQLTEVLRISQALSANLNLDALLPEIVQAIQTSLGFNIALLNMIDETDPTKMRRRAAVGIPDEHWASMKAQLIDVAWYQNVMRDEFRVSRSYFIPHSYASRLGIGYEPGDAFRPKLGERAPHEWHEEDGLFVPLYDSDGRFISVLSVDDPRDRRKPSIESVQVLEIFATQAAIAIENANTYSQTQHEAITDGLTGLYNQRHFSTMLIREVAMAGRYGYPLSLLAIDIDYFKHYNDNFGHLAGNIVLRQFADLLRQHVRDVDIVSRNGGEEFTIILPKTDLVGAAMLAERLRRTTAEHQFFHSHITVSVGVATLESLMDGETLHHLADEALYEAKNSGRNVVNVAPQRMS